METFRHQAQADSQALRLCRRKFAEFDQPTDLTLTEVEVERHGRCVGASLRQPFEYLPHASLNTMLRCRRRVLQKRGDPDQKNLLGEEWAEFIETAEEVPDVQETLRPGSAGSGPGAAPRGVLQSRELLLHIVIATRIADVVGQR